MTEEGFFNFIWWSVLLCALDLRFVVKWADKYYFGTNEHKTGAKWDAFYLKSELVQIDVDFELPK